MIYVGILICTFFHRPKLENPKWTSKKYVHFSNIGNRIGKVSEKVLESIKVRMKMKNNICYCKFYIFFVNYLGTFCVAIISTKWQQI